MTAVELQLTRASDDRRRYELPSVGRLHFGGWRSRNVMADAGRCSWQFARRGLFKAVVEATDDAGDIVRAFRSRTFGRGGTLLWSGRELTLRSISFWHNRYLLVEGDRSLARIEGKGRGKRPVRVSVNDADSIDPGLLLFATFAVLVLARDEAAAVAAGS
jgi:hypothetical protein